MGTTAARIKAAAVEAARGLFDPGQTQVIYGTRGPYTKSEVLEVGDIDTRIDRPTMGPPRSRQELHTITLIASVFRGGGSEAAQRAATERAYELIDVFAEHVRAAPNETLGVSVRAEAWISSMSLSEHTDDAEVQARGRVASVTATLTVLVTAI